MANESFKSRYKDAIRRSRKGMIFILFSALCLASGQMVWKFSGTEDILLLLIGFLIYGAGGLCLMVAFRQGSFSVLHPMLSLSYVFGMIFGTVLLNELLGGYGIVGISLIILGNVLMGVGDA